ncbi:unnamed protein product, partial [Symbiodinium microadriaticum]
MVTTETAIVPVGREPLGLQLLQDAGRPPLERLDAVMEQTQEWAQLREILQQRGPWVRDTICGLLLNEMSRSFQNVVGQLQAVQDMMTEMQATMDSEDARALHHLLRDMHPSSLAALKREADGIEESVNTLGSHLEMGDFPGLHSLAERIANKAKRFRDKYAELRPKLDRLQTRIQQIADKCAEAARRADGLIQETEDRRDSWFSLLAWINCVLTAGGLLVLVGAGGTALVAGGMLGVKTALLASATSALEAAKAQAGWASAGAFGAAVIAPFAGFLGGVLGVGAGVAAVAAQAQVASASQAVSALQVTVGWLSSVLAATPPLIIGSASILALALLGYVGRDLVRRLLKRLWAAEIQQHENSRAEFRRMEEMLRETARKLVTICEKNDALEDCFDMVVEVAEELAGTAEDVKKVVNPEALNAETLKMHEQVDRLCATYAELPRAFEELRVAVHDLAPPVQEAPAIHVQANTLVIRNDVVQPTALAVESDVQPTALAMQNDVGHIPEVEQLALPEFHGDWILIESPPLARSLASPSAHVEFQPNSDCLPLNTYLLVPVERAASLGVLLAAGPCGNCICEVISQGEAVRLMSHFSAGGEHRLTSGHPLWVQRSGSWIHERASLLQQGDVVFTSSGDQVIESVTSQISTEEVFSLNIQQNQEVFVFTINPGNDGRMSRNSVAAPSSAAQKTSRRSTSAPPRLRNNLPSRGSWFCKGTARCSNICRSFLRGRCSEGRECKYCHLPHSEESKRAARGQQSEGHPDSKTERRSIAALAFIRCFASSWTLYCGSRKRTVQNFHSKSRSRNRNQKRRIYPDEWHWREGISKPDKFREIVNAWKSSPLVAAVALSARTAQLAAELMGWKSTRLGQDDVLWKPAGASGVGYHQDSAYISQNFLPVAENSVTVWIALDDADAETGVVEYAVGSHRWPAAKASAVDSAFHGAEDELSSVRAAAAAAGAELEIKRLKVPCGAAVFHHQDVWHGSGPNTTKDRPRRALGVHLLRGDVKFRTDPHPDTALNAILDYIYGRYVLAEGSSEVSEQFFPILWSGE